MNEQAKDNRKVNGETPIPTIFDVWERQSKFLIPLNAGRSQGLMTRAAFLSGVYAVLEITEQIAEKLDDEHGATALQQVHEEAEKFSADLLVAGIEHALNRGLARF